MLISILFNLNAFAWGETFVDGEPGADGVSVVTTIDQDKCEPKAAVKVRHTGYAERLPGYIDEDLDKLAKNEAFKQGGNTVIMIENMRLDVEHNQRFIIFTCATKFFSMLGFV